MIAILHQLFWKIEKGILLNSFLESSVTLITKPKTLQEKSTRLIFPINVDAKILLKTLANQIQKYVKRHHVQVGFNLRHARLL